MLKLQQIELHLLLVFQGVMRERSVTRAAKQLGLTQPAVSASLRKLRLIFDDELFIRVDQLMMPTLRASELSQGIGEALRQLETAIQPTNFTPAKAQRTFRVAMAPQVAMVLLPRLVKQIQSLASSITLEVRTMPTTKLASVLDSNHVEIIVGVIENPPRRFRSRTLYHDRYVAVMGRDHPLAKGRLSLERFAQADHLLVTHLQRSTSLFDEAIARIGLRRNVQLIVPDFIAAAHIIASSDLVTPIYFQTVKALTPLFKDSLVFRSLPLPPSPIVALRHAGFGEHPAFLWLEEQMMIAAEPFRASDR